MYNIFIAVPSGYKSVCPELRIWTQMWALSLHKHKDVAKLMDGSPSQHRILQNRNMIVQAARESGADYILTIDPDMAPDRYAERTGKCFWPIAWEFIKQHPGSVVGVPYCGPPPDRKVHVFATTPDGTVKRLDREFCGTLSGWHKVAAVGSGMLLIDMRVFDKLDQFKASNGDPLCYFDDVYRSWDKTDVEITQDVFFCLRCKQASVPIYVNFDLWAGHRQTFVVDPEVNEFTVQGDAAGPQRSAPAAGQEHVGAAGRVAAENHPLQGRGAGAEWSAGSRGSADQGDCGGHRPDSGSHVGREIPRALPMPSLSIMH